MSKRQDFNIKSRVLIKYLGSDADVVVPEGVEKIDSKAFLGCMTLESVVLPKSLTRIGREAFRDCGNLRRVILNGLHMIVAMAFRGCGSLTEIDLPEGLTQIGNQAFEDCTALKRVRLPQSLKTICSRAFFRCTALTELDLPEISALEIGEKAFACCKSLSSLDLPEGMSLICRQAFRGCSSLKSVAFPSTLRTIGCEAFDGCGALTCLDLPKGLKNIGSSAFLNCSSLQRVTLPDNPAVLRSNFFSGCPKLLDKSGFLVLGGILVEWCGTGSEAVVPEGVTAILDRAFTRHPDLRRVTLPKSLVRIGRAAFLYCEALTGIDLPEGLTEICADTFRDCAGLRYVNLPQSLTRIGSGAFGRCSSLTDLTLPAAVKEIGTHAFAACTFTLHADGWIHGLGPAIHNSGIRMLDLRDYAGVEDPAWPAVARWLQRQDACDPDGEAQQEGLRLLTEHCAAVCRPALKEPALLQFLCARRVIPPGDVDLYISEAQETGDQDSLSLLLEYQNRLGFARIEEARAARRAEEEERELRAFAAAERRFARLASGTPVENIAGFCFAVRDRVVEWSSREAVRVYLEECGASLTSSVTMATDYLVSDRSRLDTELLRAAEEYEVPVLSPLEFSYLVKRYYQPAETLVIPSWVKRILPDALRGQRGVRRLVAGPGLRAVEEGAFRSCDLESAELAEGLVRIGPSAFRDCAGLTSVRLPDTLEVIGQNAFLGCRQTEYFCSRAVMKLVRHSFQDAADAALIHNDGRGPQVCLPEGVEKIPDRAFLDCKNIRRLILQEDVTEIGFESFKDCRAMESVELPAGLTVIGVDAFFHCSGLTAVTVPEGVVRIGKGAFCACWNLERITLPASVTEIGTGAFRMCPKRVLHAPAGSYAEQYAKQNDIPFVPL